MAKNPKLYKGKITNKNWLNAHTVLVSIQVVAPDDFSFEPGQFVSIKVGNPAFRSYSISSDPNNSRLFDLIIDTKEPGLGSSFFKDIQIDTEVEFIGPSGKFVLDTAYASNLVFVCTGVGLAPFVPMLMQLERAKYLSQVQLYFGVRREEDAFMLEFLNEIKSKLRNFEFTVCYSQEESPSNGKSGRVTKHLQIVEPSNSQIYLCGNPNMIEDVLAILHKQGVHNDHIHYEKFTVVPKIS